MYYNKGEREGRRIKKKLSKEKLFFKQKKIKNNFKDNDLNFDLKCYYRIMNINIKFKNKI